MKLILAILFFFVSIYLSVAQPAPLDSTFGLNGVLRFSYDFSSLLRDMELLPDGKILVAGGTPNGVYLAKFNPDGSSDTFFGNNGILPTSIENIGLHLDLIPLPDGKFMSVGQTKDLSSPFQNPLIALLRYHANGMIDSTFGQNGLVTTRIGIAAFPQFGALQADGKILVCGQANLGTGLRYAWTRYYPDGRLDSTFSVNGITTLASPGSGVPSSMLVLPNGKILTGGTDAGSVPNARFLISRLLPDGEPDASFATNGVFSTWFGHNYETISDLAVQTDGKILAGGWLGNTTDGDMVLFRLNENGSVDTDFGNDGMVVVDVGHDDIISALDLLPNGKIVASGSSASAFSSGGPAPNEAQVLRFHPNGVLDSSFNAVGKGALSVGAAAGSEMQIIQPDGKILLGGFYYATDSSAPHILLARILNDNTSHSKNPDRLKNVTVSPNPSSGTIKLDFTLSEPTILTILLTDTQGRVVKNLKSGRWIPSGPHTAFFEVQQLPKGVYYIVLEASGGIKVLTWIKQD